MSKFKAGDRVRHKRYHAETATILAVHDFLYWVEWDDEDWPLTVSASSIDRIYKLATEGEL